MKVSLISAYLLINATIISAQTLKVEPSKQAPRIKAQSTKVLSQEPLKPDVPTVQAPLPATGPSGMGAIRLGMSKDALMALSVDEPVRLVSELTRIVKKTDSSLGVEEFEGLIAVTLRDKPVEANFTFKDGGLQLLSLRIAGEDTFIESLATKIAVQYGAGKVDDSRTEKQCIFRNGNSITIKSGYIITSWSTLSVDGKVIQTSFANYTFKSCPLNLGDNLAFSMKSQILVISLEDQANVSPKNNLF
jgi:hypothetical protein